MRVLVTGSAGHLGEALVRKLRAAGHEAVSLDLIESHFTDHVGSITDPDFVRQHVKGTDVILHAATLHKPHVATHSRQAFVDTNVTGTLNLLEAAVEAGCSAFVFTSTTSTFGDAMRPAEGQPAVWVTEALRPAPRNIYGVTKTAAEDLCELFHRNAGLPCVVLRTSRFFAEADDNKARRDAFADGNIKLNELLFRRADLEDIADAHLLALEHAGRIGFDRLIVTATTPFQPDDVAELRRDAPAVVARYVPEYADLYADRNWRMFGEIDRVYDNARARRVLNWQPKVSFAGAVDDLRTGRDYRSDLAITVGTKAYHAVTFAEGPYPVGKF